MFEQHELKASKAVIKVMGVGGGGCNAINSMIDSKVSSAEFIAVNTDNQALLLSKADYCIQIGAELTKGLGAGSNPNIGEQAAEESKEEITEFLQGTDLLFIAAGMGGGTGTGATPVIARIARELGILTVAVVTKPFSFEGRVRNENANKGIANLKKYVDTLVIIPNDKLLQFLPANVGILDAFKVADDMLKQGIMSIVDLITTPSLINLDFADVNTVMRNQGLAHMGIGRARGENRVIEAVRQAVSSPLLETTIEGAKAVIINVCGGNDLCLKEASEAANLIKGIIDQSANIIFGTTIDPSIVDEIKISVIATGFTADIRPVGNVVERQREVAEEEKSEQKDGEENLPLLKEIEKKEENVQGKETADETVGIKEAVASEPEDVEEIKAEPKIEERKTDLPAFMRKLFRK